MTAPSTTRQWPYSKTCLTDLPEDLLTSILKQLPLKTKCQAQAVCRMFRDTLSKPYKGSFVWESIQLDDPLLEAASPSELARQVLCPKQTEMNILTGAWYVDSFQTCSPRHDLTCCYTAGSSSAQTASWRYAMHLLIL